MLMTVLTDSLFLKAAADEEPEAAAAEENDEEEKPEEKENDSEPDKPADGAADAVYGNGGNELSETHTVEDTVLSESVVDAGTVDKESELTSGADGEGSSTEENESEESSGGETAESADQPERGDRDGGHESGTDRRGSPEVAETVGERETGREGETGTKSEPQTEPESETPSEAGTEDRPEPVNRQDNDYYIRTLVETLEEMGFGTEDETETGTTETETETEMETSVMHEDLQQLHTDLQVICCFIVVFFIISLCSYIYRFFKIFF